MEFKTAGIKCYEWNQKDSAVDVERGWDLLGFMVEGAFELDIKRQVWFWEMRSRENNSMKVKQMELKAIRQGLGVKAGVVWTEGSGYLWEY